MGALGFSEVRDAIAAEHITATPDARAQGADLDPGPVVDTGAEAKEFAEIIRAHVLEEPYPVERERLAAALEGDGFDVEVCSGPTAPDYTCMGARIGRCPLATGDCVVVLDMDLDSEAADLGTSAEELLAFYLGAEHRVVTLSSRPTGTDDDRLRQLRRHPETDDLLAAVWWSASPSASGQPVSSSSDLTVAPPPVG